MTHTVVASQVAREAPPVELALDGARALNAFSLRLHAQLAGHAANVFTSPLSVAWALALVGAGARGQTARELAPVLGGDPSQLGPHRRLNALAQLLLDPGGAFTLQLSNALWGQTGRAFAAEYLDRLAAQHGAGVHAVDFAADPEAARATINAWVAEETAGRIPALLGPQAVTGDTRLVLTNAVRFLAKWASPFEGFSTHEQEFHTVRGAALTPFMRQRLPTLPYARVEGPEGGLEAIDLGYVGEEVGLVCLLPRGDLSWLERSLDPSQLDAILAQLAPTDVYLSLPKFSFHSRLSLRDALAALGLETLFQFGPCDLSGIDETRELFVGEIGHEAFVAVNEEGTEAAAATFAAAFAGGAPAPPQVTLTLDRPFLFLIRERRTGAILFLGRLSEPG